MKAVIQRVQSASVVVSGKTISEIKTGWLVLLGVGREDSKDSASYLAKKICDLRGFEDKNGKINLSVKDLAGELLVVSQFTLYGDCRKGRRPSMSSAAQPELARSLYEFFCEKTRAEGIVTKTGEFGAEMKVGLVNDGPVTFTLESPRV